MVVVLSVVAMATHFLPPTDDKTPHHSSTGCGRPRPPLTDRSLVLRQYNRMTRLGHAVKENRGVDAVPPAATKIIGFSTAVTHQS